MKKLVITALTRNTKALRLKIYKAALELMQEHVNKYGLFMGGFCSAIANSTYVPPSLDRHFTRFNPYFELERSVYKELLKYKPNTDGRTYWFSRDIVGSERRIAILEEIIKEMSK